MRRPLLVAGLALSTLAALPPSSARAQAAREESDRLDLTFWRRLGDTTLDRLMDEAARANLDVRAAQARLDAARSARTRARLELTPEASLAGGYTRQRLSSATFPGGSGSLPDQAYSEAGLVASWEVDVFGRLRQNARAQGELAATSSAEVRQARLVMAAELARAYFELRGAQELLEVARRNADNQRRSLELTRQRLEAGRGTAFDTARAMSQLSFTLATIPLHEYRVAQAQYRIGALVGRSPTVVARELAAPRGRPPLPEAVDVGEVGAVVRARPDVSAAERYAAAQGSLAGSARADYLPRLQLAGSAGYSSSEFSSLGGTGTGRYTLGLVVSWPLLNLGRVRADVAAAGAREDEARARHDQLVLTATQQVETAAVAYRSARERVIQLERASAAGERAAELARTRYAEGVSDFLQVLDAERTQLETQELLAQARTDAAVAYAALYLALGGR